jgi:hypothetical protein
MIEILILIVQFNEMNVVLRARDRNITHNNSLTHRYHSKGEMDPYPPKISWHKRRCLGLGGTSQLFTDNIQQSYDTTSRFLIYSKSLNVQDGVCDIIVYKACSLHWGTTCVLKLFHLIDTMKQEISSITYAYFKT